MKAKHIDYEKEIIELGNKLSKATKMPKDWRLFDDFAKFIIEYQQKN